MTSRQGADRLNLPCPRRGILVLLFALVPTALSAQQPAAVTPVLPSDGHRPRIENGIAYSDRYVSSDFATRVNNCLADAESGVASSHICDSTGEAIKQSINEQITIGNKANARVTWIHGGQCSWNVTINDGKQFALFQYGGSRVYGANQQRNGCEITNTSPDRGLAGIYNNAGGGYYQFGDFTFREGSGILTGKAVMQVSGGYDNSYYHDLTILNYLPNTTGLFLGGEGPCCSLMFERMSIGGNDTGGTMVDVEGHGVHEVPAIWFFNSSFGWPARGKPIFICHDTGSAYMTSVGFFGTYEELSGSQADGPINRVDGCASIFAHGFTIEAVHGAAQRSVQAWTFSKAFPTAVSITNLTMNHGFPLPTPAIVTSAGATIYTDAGGGLANYTSNISYADSLGLPIKTPPPHESCTPGTILGTDADFLYVCSASGTVKRAALAAY